MSICGVQAVPIPGLELGTLLAASPYGRTLRGFYKGQAVAVKVLPSITQSQAYTHHSGFSNKLGILASSSLQGPRGCCTSDMLQAACQAPGASLSERESARRAACEITAAPRRS